jgi:uncharacterized protein (UPF0332 family)
VNRLAWCAEINNGIALVDPNDNLASAYLKKAENALDAMHSVNPKEWKISTGYYSLYFSLYAVLMKIGIHSENHICSLEVMRELLKEYFTNAEVEMIDRARRSRIDCQYYTSGDVPDVLLAAMITDVPRFLVRCRTIANQLTSDDIAAIRDVYRKLTTPEV